MRKWFLLICLLIAPLYVLAQSVEDVVEAATDDKGFLTNLLEEKLSGAGRQIVISGFEGALSSRATFTKIAIADDEGVWITLHNGAIQWNRSALLRGRVEIAEMSAQKIELPRLPGGGENAEAKPEATGFALPELPVGINIDKIQSQRVELGEPIIGVAAAISIDGKMSLAGGEGQADLTIKRLDGPRGEFVLATTYSNASQELQLNLSLDEAADGLLVNLVDLYDKPAVTAQISGSGPLDGFKADLRLATEGVPRVTGDVSVQAEDGPNGAPGRAFRVSLGGDIATLLPPEDRSFFGEQSQLQAEGWRGNDGALDIPVLKVDTDAVDVSGSLVVKAQGAPQSAKLSINLGQDAGAREIPVKLPGGPDAATVESGKLLLNYDAAEGEGWTLEGSIGALDPGSVAIKALHLDGAGQVVVGDDGALGNITGAFDFGSEGIVFDDPALAQAIGDMLTGKMAFTYGAGRLEVTEVNVDGRDYGLTGDAVLSDFKEGGKLVADIAARYEDLGRISELAGREMSGSAMAKLSGSYGILSKGFDLKAEVNGSDIALDQAQLDSLLAGQSTVLADVKRDEAGIELRQLKINAQQLEAEAKGYLTSEASDLNGTLTLASLTDLADAYGGAMVADFQMTGASGARQLVLNADAMDLVVGIEALDRALKGETKLVVRAGQVEDGFAVQDLKLTNPQLSADAKGDFTAGAMQATADFSLPDLSAIMPDWNGGLTATAKLDEADGVRRIDVTGEGQDLRFGASGAGGQLTGQTDLIAKIEERSGAITIKDLKLNNEQLNATAQGVYSEAKTDLTGKIEVTDFEPLGLGVRGALQVDASMKDDGTGSRKFTVDGTGQDLAMGQAQLDGALVGETVLKISGVENGGIVTIESAQIENPRLAANAEGKLGGGVTDLMLDLNASDLRFLGNGIGGAVDATARLTEQDGTRRIEAEGNAQGLSIGQERVDPILRGQTRFDLAAAQSEAGLRLDRLLVENPQIRASADGDPAAALNIQARLNDLALIQPGFPGAVEVDGTLRQSENSFDIDADVSAPGDTALQIAGSAARDFSTTDISVTGSTDASIANSFIRTRSVEGPVEIDLQINGPPSLNAVSGEVRLANVSLAEPKLGIRMEGINVTAGLQNGLIQLDGAANVVAGGRILLNGPVDLRAGTLDINVVLDNVVARDPNLYETVLSGNVRMSGRNADGPLISGQINLGKTEFRIPSTGLGGAKDIPDISHVGDTRPVRSTRAKAGLEPFGGSAANEAGLGGPAATPPANPPKLDLTINAPNQLFIRGRGVDAEMGGQLTVQGTTRRVVPIGHFELIRGRVDLLGKRFDLTEGLVELQGSLIPILRLVAQTEEDGVTTRVIIDGEVRDPDIIFESSPEMPQEEVLSQLLFGRGLDNISPLQAAQLANAIAVLAGQGGVGIVNNLRNQVGLDDLDLATDDEGNVQVRAGKYLTDNVYTDVAVGDDGTSTINLNLDVSQSVRARGSVASDGESTIGVYYERDY